MNGQRFSGLQRGEVLRRWEGHFDELKSQEEIDREMTRATAWRILCVVGLGWVIATALLALLFLI